MEKHKLSFFSAERVFSSWLQLDQKVFHEDRKPNVPSESIWGLARKADDIVSGPLAFQSARRPLLHTTSAADDMIGKCQVDNDEFSIEPLLGSDSRALHTMAPQKNKTADDWIISWSFHLFLSLVANHIPHLTDRMKNLTLVFSLTRVKLF